MFMKNYSIWNENNKVKFCKAVSKNIETDVLIVGGGITGISTLYQLKNNGINAILVERNTCGEGVTSRSTAKITYLQEKIYMSIRNLVNEDMAKKYLKSQIDAVKMIKNIIQKEKISCDFHQVDSYLFTNEKSNVSKIEEEYQFLKSNHVSALKVSFIPFPLEFKSAIKVPDTYVIHPLKYIHYFKNQFYDSIYENSKVESINKENNIYISLVNGYQVKSKYVIIATHYPYFLIPYLLPIKTHIETSYIGAKKVSNYQNISAINIDKPCISMRYHYDGKNNYLVYLYGSFMSCNIKNIQDNFDHLKKQYEFDYVWSNKDIITNDYMPIIGRIKNSDDTLLIACGYNTWGFTNSTLASVILRDIILKKENPYTPLFSPHRTMNLSKAIRFPIDVGSSVKSILKSTKNNVNNSHVIYKKIHGENVMIYKDENGVEHIVKKRCPHMKCGLVFNETEKTWDCLCHGSRFSIDGKCIEGPSNFDINFKN